MTSLNSTVDCMLAFTKQADEPLIPVLRVPVALREFCTEVAEVFAGAFGCTFAAAIDRNDAVASLNNATRRDLGR